MKKFILMMTLIFSVFVSANAQYKSSNLLDNVRVGVQAGATTPLDFNSVFPVNPTATLFIEKGITPVLSARLEGTALFGAYNYGKYGPKPLNISNTFVKGVNVGLDGVVNLGNLVKGYTGTPRVFEVSTVAGLGWMHAYNHNGAHNGYNFMTAKTAVDLALNLGAKKAVQVYVEPAVNWLLTDDEGVLKGFDSRRAQLGLNVGLVYKFKTSNGTHNFAIVRPYDEVEVAELRGRINELEKLLKEKPAVVEVKTPGKVSPVTPYLIMFDKGSANLTEASKKALLMLSKDKSLSVSGYASKDTGTDDFNQNLSERRAHAVAEFLKANGYTVNEVAGRGYTPLELQRAVVVK